jgi:hypothetical protein
MSRHDNLFFFTTPITNQPITIHISSFSLVDLLLVTPITKIFVILKAQPEGSLAKVITDSQNYNQCLVMKILSSFFTPNKPEVLPHLYFPNLLTPLLLIQPAPGRVLVRW